MKKLLPIVLLLSILSCREDDPEPIEIGLNGNLEVGSSYPYNWYSSPQQAGFDIRWTDEESFSPTNSLFISSDVSNPNEFAFWGQQICSSTAVGKRLILKVRVKGTLTGNGVSVALRADGANSSAAPLAFVTTQGTLPLTGTLEWRHVTVEMPVVPDGTACLYIFLVYIQYTTGGVYFDDISLTYQ